MTHFFLYPVGHFGLIAVTFLMVLPLTQLIVFMIGVGFEICGASVFEVGVGVGTGAGNGVSCVSLTCIVGEENSKLLALKYSQPSFSLETVVATSLFPSAETTEIEALIGAEVKP